MRRGQDTVAMEQFTRTATRLEGTLHLRNSSRTSERYSAVVAPDASPIRSSKKRFFWSKMVLGTALACTGQLADEALAAHPAVHQPGA